MNGESIQYPETGESQRQASIPTTVQYSSIPQSQQSMTFPPESTTTLSSTSPSLQHHQRYMQSRYVPHMPPHSIQRSLPLYHSQQPINETSVYRDSGYSHANYSQYAYMAVPHGPYYRPVRSNSSFTQPPAYQSSTHSPSSKRSTNPFPIDSRDNQRIQHIIQGIEDSFQNQSAKLKHPDIQTPFSNIDDVINRLLPYHLISLRPLSSITQKRTDLEERTNNMLYQIGSKISNSIYSPSQIDISILHTRIILRLEREALRSIQLDIHNSVSSADTSPVTPLSYPYQTTFTIQQPTLNRSAYRPVYLPGSIYRQVYQPVSEKPDSLELDESSSR